MSISCKFCQKTPEQSGTLFYIKRHDTDLESWVCIEHMGEDMTRGTGYTVLYFAKPESGISKQVKNFNPRAVKLLDAVIDTIRHEEGWTWYPSIEARIGLLTLFERGIK